MARDEQNREDLLAQATALVERASLRLPGHADETVVGFRRDGGLAIYFSPELVYQFNSTGKLRRAFVGDLLFKAQAGTLVSLERERGVDVVHLVSRRLDAEATQAFLLDMHSHLTQLQRSLLDGSYALIGQVPAGTDVLSRVRQWLTTFAGGVGVARSPRSA